MTPYYPTPPDPYHPYTPTHLPLDPYHPLPLHPGPLYTYPPPDPHMLDLHHLYPPWTPPPLPTLPPTHPWTPPPTNHLDSHHPPTHPPPGPHHPLAEFCVQFWSLFHGQDHLVLSIPSIDKNNKPKTKHKRSILLHVRKIQYTFEFWQYSKFGNIDLVDFCTKNNIQQQSVTWSKI